MSLEEDGIEFSAAYDVEFSYIIGLFEGTSDPIPDAQDAVDYHETIGSPDIPVLADLDQELLGATPYDGSQLPGQCILSPEMEIVMCSTGHTTEPTDELAEIVMAR